MSVRSPQKHRFAGETVDPQHLPKLCFVSHSYKDKAALDKLRQAVPKKVKLVIFPLAEPDSSQPISNEIIPKILDCPGLIYLRGGASSRSFWVKFERDYALRASRKVFAYNPRTGTFKRDISPPIPLNLTVMYHMDDHKRVRRLLSWMAKERHFKIDNSELRTTTGGFTGDVMVTMQELLVNGGTVLWLMGVKNTKVAYLFYSERFVEYLLDDEDNDSLWDLWRDRIADQFPGYDAEYEEQTDGLFYEEDIKKSKEDFLVEFYRHIQQVVARIDPSLPASWVLLPWNSAETLTEGGIVDLEEYRMLDLYEGTGRKFNWNRVDDLIIAIYQRLLR